MYERAGQYERAASIYIQVSPRACLLLALTATASRTS